MGTDYLSETESDTSSVMGDYSSSVDGMKPPSPAPREQLQKRIESLLQENRVLKVELETYKLRVRTLQEENKSLKQASVLIQAKAEQEEEFISNTLLKKIQELKKEKEVLALNYEQEEEFLTNDLSKKLHQLRNEKMQLTATLQQEQESLVNRLMRKIRKLESETSAKQNHLDQIRREKVELENTLEQEQESLVNRLWKRMDKLEAEKRCLQEKLEQPMSAPPSPMDVSVNPGASPAHIAGSLEPHGAVGGNVGVGLQPSIGATPGQGLPIPGVNGNSGANGSIAGSSGPGPKRQRSMDAAALSKHIQSLREEVTVLKDMLKKAEESNTAVAAQYAKEEQKVREENLRLRRKLEMEVERRQDLCRHLSESESSLEIEDERHFNELSSHRQIPPPPASVAVAAAVAAAQAHQHGQGGQMGAYSAVQHGGHAMTTTTMSGAGNLAPVSRGRTTSSPIQYPVAGMGRPISPALGGLNVNVSLGPSNVYSPPSPMSHARCHACGSMMLPTHFLTGQSPMVGGIAMVPGMTPGILASHHPPQGSLGRTKSQSEKFARPANPPTPKAASPAPSPSGSHSASSSGNSSHSASTTNMDTTCGGDVGPAEEAGANRKQS